MMYLKSAFTNSKPIVKIVEEKSLFKTSMGFSILAQLTQDPNPQTTQTHHLTHTHEKSYTQYFYYSLLFLVFLIIIMSTIIFI
jgi:hypothetical protein